MWTRFHDMHSGGSQKEQWNLIFIEASQAEAELIFYNRFGHNPNRVSCTCCGPDYSIGESETLDEATRFYDAAVPHYTKLVIPASDIHPWEREGELPEQGYVWV